MRVGWHLFAKPTEGNNCKRKNMGLYRDDGLAIFKNMSGSEVERKKKGTSENT